MVLEIRAPVGAFGFSLEKPTPGANPRRSSFGEVAAFFWGVFVVGPALFRVKRCCFDF